MRLFSTEALPVGLFGKETFPTLSFLLLMRHKTWANETGFNELFSKEVFFGNSYIPNTNIIRVAINHKTFKVNVIQKKYKVVIR